MKKLIIFISLAVCASSFSQTQRPINDIEVFIPFVTVKDIIEEAYEYYCISDHPNCWAGIGERFVGMDTIRVFRTYIIIDSDSVLIDEKRHYLTGPKGSVISGYLD